MLIILLILVAYVGFGIAYGTYHEIKMLRSRYRLHLAIKLSDLTKAFLAAVFLGGLFGTLVAILETPIWNAVIFQKKTAG